MRLYRTDEGIARLEGEELAVLDLPHPDLAALFADSEARPASARVKARRSLADAVLLAPVARPARVVIVGFNYRSHVQEMGLAVPAAPPLGALPAGPGVTVPWNGEIVLPASAPAMVDYEGELGAIIGHDGRIAGLTVVNDVSARDVQQRAMQTRDPALGLGKLFPSFKPCGPCVVTPDELPLEGLDLELTQLVNGELRQRARTGDLIFPIPALIAAASAQAVLAPGDLICTGTPSGVGAATGVFLKPGDVVEVRIAGLGALRNRVVAADG